MRQYEVALVRFSCERQQLHLSLDALSVVGGAAALFLVGGGIFIARGSLIDWRRQRHWFVFGGIFLLCHRRCCMLSLVRSSEAVASFV